MNRHLAGIKVSPIRMVDLLEQVREAMTTRRRLSITYINPDYARRALRDHRLLNEMNAFDLVLVDGNGIRIASPLFGFVVPERLDTDAVAPLVFDLMAKSKSRVFLLGCAPGVVERAATKLEVGFPDLVIAGTEHGYHDVLRGHPMHFNAEDSAMIVDKINASGADFLLVSLPTPLQQRWLAEHADKLDVPLIMTGGSYLDHVADSEGLEWYPRWANRFQLNWFYRLSCDPTRLWRRYTIEFAEYFLRVLRHRVSPAVRPVVINSVATSMDSATVDVRTAHERVRDRRHRADGRRATVSDSRHGAGVQVLVTEQPKGQAGGPYPAEPQSYTADHASRS